jgi:hypothetical protein
LASERLTLLNKHDKALLIEKKKKYFKIVESYLSNEFEAKLKKIVAVKGEYW